MPFIAHESTVLTLGEPQNHNLGERMRQTHGAGVVPADGCVHALSVEAKEGVKRVDNFWLAPVMSDVGPTIKRLVDLVDRAPEDDLFFPTAANTTLFRRTWPRYQNAVQEIVEIGYQGNAAWGQRITIPLTHKDSGDLLQWVCLRLQPRSWLPPAVDAHIRDGTWDYGDPSGAWMWAGSLGTAAIALVELQVGDTVVESWPGEWMDIWSRLALDSGRAGTWDADIYAQAPATTLHDTSRPPWTTVQPTEDGYVYCWFPLTFFRRPAAAFPLVAAGDTQSVQLNVTLRPFADVVRRRARPRTSDCETPLGATEVFVDVTGLTPIPWEITLPTTVPGFEDTTVFAGVVQVGNPKRESLMRVPMEMRTDPVSHDVYAVSATGGRNVNLRLNFNGPLRELVWVLRRRDVWGYNEWTNYGARLEDALVAGGGRQVPLLARARLRIGTAVWRDDAEQWWRVDCGLAHRGGVRAVDGMVYGCSFGEQGTVNASETEMRLELEIAAAAATDLEVHVFAQSYNWMRFVGGLVGPLFQD